MVFKSTVVILSAIISIAAAVDFCDRRETQRDQLLQLIVVTRHGWRTPIRTFPTDRYQESFWEEYGGFGQLTRQGIAGQYMLGQFFRKCYSTLQKKPIISAFSTPYDRTIMSANSFLAGLMIDPEDKSLTIGTILQQILQPVHALPEHAKPFECTPKPWCGDEANVLPVLEQKEIKYKPLLEAISKQAGLNSSAYWEIAANVSDATFMEKAAGLELVDWIEKNDTILALLNEMRDFYMTLLHGQQPMPLRTLAYTSPLLNFLIPYLRNATVERSQTPVSHPSPNMVLISAHDTNIAALLSAFGSFDDITPPVSSALIIELSKTDNASDPVKVQVFYRNDSLVDPYPVKVRNGCGFSCSIDKFADSLKDAMRPIALKPESSLMATVNLLQSVVPVDVKVSLILFVGFCAIAVISIIAAICSCSRRRKKNVFYRLNQKDGEWQEMNSSPTNRRRSSPSRTPHDNFFDDEDDFGDEGATLQTRSGSSARQPLLMSS